MKGPTSFFCVQICSSIDTTCWKLIFSLSNYVGLRVENPIHWSQIWGSTSGLPLPLYSNGLHLYPYAKSTLPQSLFYSKTLNWECQALASILFPYHFGWTSFMSKCLTSAKETLMTSDLDVADNPSSETAEDRSTGPVLHSWQNRKFRSCLRG